MRVKRGLAEMLSRGVIMDVVTAEHARIAEDAGAAAVMALERVPADIRRDGGVARMSPPEMIESIVEAVTIPVMAKARIGHFAEAQILEALGVDYIDESEVLTPADEAHHIDKWQFTVPFVCGATGLGEALRRISEGAAMIRSKGEAGTGNIIEAVRHLRSITGDIRRITVADEAELYDWAKRLQAPVTLVREIAGTGRLAVPLFCAGGVATPADASLVMQLGAEAVFVGSGIFKSDNPQARAKAVVEATTNFDDPAILLKVSRGLGEAMPGLELGGLETRLADAVGDGRPVKVGVLALQGAADLHLSVLASIGAAAVAVRRPDELADVDRLILPGGESTTISMMLDANALSEPLAERLAGGMAAFGTCAGLLLLAAEVIDGRDDQQCFGALDISARRNAYGPQTESFEAELPVAPLGEEPTTAIFIRSPIIERTGPDVEVLARFGGHPVLCRQGNVWGATFHPELSGDSRLHRLFCEESF